MTEKERSGKNKLLEAMRVSEKSYCDQFVPAEGEIRYSEEYLRDMERILKQSRKPLHRYFNTIGKRIAGIAAAILILFGCSMTVSAVREPVMNFFVNIYDKFVEIVFGEDSITKTPDVIDSVYTLGVVPDGYAIDKINNQTVYVYTVWKNDSGDRIVLFQGILRNALTLDAEESDYTIFERNGRRIAFIEKNEYKAFYWNSEKYEFRLIIPNDMTQEDAFTLIDSFITYNSKERD